MMITIANIKNKLSRLWLIGTLFRIARSEYFSAFFEFAYLLIWSILPFGLGALTLYVTSPSSMQKDFFEFAILTFRNGELLVFTISMLAPILFMTLHDPEESKPFPHKLPLSTCVALIMIMCASLFALMKAKAVQDPVFVFDLSVILTIVALSFRYLAIVYHKYRMPQVTERKLREPQNDFVEQVKQRIGENNPLADSSTFTDHLQQHLGKNA